MERGETIFWPKEYVAQWGVLFSTFFLRIFQFVPSTFRQEGLKYVSEIVPRLWFRQKRQFFMIWFQSIDQTQFLIQELKLQLRTQFNHTRSSILTKSFIPVSVTILFFILKISLEDKLIHILGAIMQFWKKINPTFWHLQLPIN